MLAADSIHYEWMASQGKVGYPSDVSDEEWAFVLPYLLLSREDSAHREHDLRAVFNGVRNIARTGNQWRFMPHDYPPWPAIFQQMQRWMRLDALSGWSRTRAFCCASLPDARASRRQRVSTAAPCNPRPRAVRGLATTARNGARVRRFTLQSTRWVICLRCA